MPRPRGYSAKRNNSSKTMSVGKPKTSDAPIPMDSKARKAAKKKVKRSFKQTAGSVGLLVTVELDTAIARCKARVENIAANCRARNQKFRDEDFDLENQKEACLWGLEKPAAWETEYKPDGIMRVGDIFEAPVFFEEGASSSDIKQGSLGDCWFLSGLAVVATVPGLMEKICVARDELAGVYGFIFFRDDRWLDVIIDDQLFVNACSYEWLSAETKAVYKYSPELYDSIGRRGSSILYYGKSAAENETWVPLIEKAYAKFYGNYAYLSGGYTMHAMEDLTGGVCRRVLLNDVLDKDLLWEQICRNTDRSKLYGCGSIKAPELTTSHNLVRSHAYAILRAREYNGKRFLVIRNPWGNGTEWNGPWSDGSKEWTAEWRPALELLDHTFGQDGQFIMEFSEFQRQWPMLDITRIFDSSWVSSSIWIDLPGMVVGQVPTWGDVSFTISVPEHTEALIALQQVDSRAFNEISGYLAYDLSFVVFKKGSTKEVVSSQSCLRWEARGQSAEVELDAGEYVLHVRISPWTIRQSNYIETGQETWNADIFRKLIARRTAAYAKAINYLDESSEDLLPTTIDSIAGYDLTELEMKTVETKREEVLRKQSLREARISKAGKDEPAAKVPSTNGTNGTSEEHKGDAAKPADGLPSTPKTTIQEDTPDETSDEGSTAEEKPATATTPEPEPKPADAAKPKEWEHFNVSCDLCKVSPIVGPRYHCTNEACPDFDICHACFDKREHDQTHQMTVFCTPKEIVHQQECSTCKVKPIVGTLYACSEDDCTLPFSCGTCFAKVRHNPKHVIVMAREADEEETTSDRPVHAGIHCDYCEMDPIIGTRYKCMHAKCPDYDLCDECVVKGIHDAGHQMLPIKTPEEADYLHPGVSDGSPLVLGLRVYTKSTAKVVLGAQLKHLR